MTRLVLAHLKSELLALSRMPGFLIPSFVFPGMFFLMFAAPYLRTPEAAVPTTASFMAFAFFTVVFFQYGVGLAQERENPWIPYLRTLPLPAGVRPAAYLLTGLLFALAAALVVAAVAAAATPFGLPAGRWPLLLAALVLGAVPHGLMGLTLAYLARPRAALALANLIFLPLSYLGGLWMPPSLLPDWAQRISPWLPTRHWAELVWAAAAGRPWPAASLLTLLGYAALFAFIAAWAWRRGRG